MSSTQQVQLSKLREIGWTEWDPIGLKAIEPDWETHVIDEYDRYLLHVASMLKNGQSTDAAAKYLLSIAQDYMGLSHVSVDKAQNTAKAIQAYLSSL
jgi:hypothetical protein